MIYNSLKKFFIAALLLLISILIGVIGFIAIEGYSLVDSLYMTFITLSTVGFKEVEPLSSTGKIFVILYIMLNIGIFAYVVSIITTYIFEGELQRVIKSIMFERMVKKLKHHVIVCGYGRNGSRACLELQNSRTPFVIIEKDSNQLEYLKDPQIPVIRGDATLDDTLTAAQIQNAKALITSLPHDADNVYITLTAKELNPDIFVIARASDQHAEKKLYRAGANRVVMPDILGGIHMANLITKPFVIEFLDILNGVGDSELKLEEFAFNQLKDKYKNKTIKELDIRKNTGATVVGIKDANQGFLFGPNINTVIGEKDILILLGSDESIHKFRHYCH